MDVPWLKLAIPAKGYDRKTHQAAPNSRQRKKSPPRVCEKNVVINHADLYSILPEDLEILSSTGYCA